MQLGEFIDVAAGGETAAATASLNLLQLLTASAFVLEKNSGHALSIPTTTISVPGIASVTASATVIEPPKYYFGPGGGAGGRDGPGAPFGQPGHQHPRPARQHAVQPDACRTSSGSLGLPAQPAAAGRRHRSTVRCRSTSPPPAPPRTLSAINCATPSITVASTTQAVNLNAAVNLNLNVTLAGSPLLNAARVNIAAGAKTTPANSSTTFISPSEFGPSNAKSVGSSALGLNGLLNVTTPTSPCSTGAAQPASTSGLIAGLVVPVLNTLLTSLDNALIVPLTKTLGVKLGGADIAALGVGCNGLRLAG